MRTRAPQVWKLLPLYWISTSANSSLEACQRRSSLALNSLVEAFGLNVKRRRERLRLTQAELAYLAQLHPGEISRIERGVTNPRMTTVLTLALALEVEPMVLLDRRFYKGKTLAKMSATLAEDYE